ncbi:MAG: hypothetical protein J6W35_08265 [Eubacterium sp.]|nr:hypothetical protein [Eubacterium sp.]
MIGIAIAYWLIINTIGVSAIVASMCRPNEKPVNKTDEKTKIETKEDKYPSDYFESLKESKEQEYMEKLLDKINSAYKSADGVANNFVLSSGAYKKVTYKTLHDTFVLKYGFCMTTASGKDFTHTDYLNEYPLYLFQDR